MIMLVLIGVMLRHYLFIFNSSSVISYKTGIDIAEFLKSTIIYWILRYIAISSFAVILFLIFKQYIIIHIINKMHLPISSIYLFALVLGFSYDSAYSILPVITPNISNPKLSNIFDNAGALSEKTAKKIIKTKFYLLQYGHEYNISQKYEEAVEYLWKKNKKQYINKYCEKNPDKRDRCECAKNIKSILVRSEILLSYYGSRIVYESLKWANDKRMLDKRCEVRDKITKAVVLVQNGHEIRGFLKDFGLCNKTKCLISMGIIIPNEVKKNVKIKQNIVYLKEMGNKKFSRYPLLRIVSKREESKEQKLGVLINNMDSIEICRSLNMNIDECAGLCM